MSFRVTIFLALILLSASAWAQSAYAESPPTRQADENTRALNPSAVVQKHSEVVFFQYMKALDERRFKDAYAMLAPSLRDMAPFTKWKKLQEYMYEKLGGEPEYANIQAVWKQGPPQSPGTYAIYSFHSRYKNIKNCLELVVLRQRDDNSFEIVRHERNILDIGDDGAATQIELKELRETTGLEVTTQTLVQDGNEAGLPELSGYGELPDLRTAIARDNNNQDPASLIPLIGSIKNVPLEELFTRDVEQDVKAIMYRWAGADGIAPDARGPNIDARDLGFLEKFMGEPFVQKGADGRPDPLFWAALSLNQAFYKAFNNIYSRLLIQVGGGDLFKGEFRYDISKDALVGITGLDLVNLARLKAIADLMPPQERYLFWRRVVRMIHYAVNVRQLPDEDLIALTEAVAGPKRYFTLSGLLFDIVHPHPRYLPGSSYAGRVLGLDVRYLSFPGIFREARRKDNSKQIVLAGVVTDYIQSCCNGPEAVISLMRTSGFQASDLTEKYNQKNVFGWKRYDQILYGEKTGWLDKIKRKMSMPWDVTFVTVYLNNGKVDWAYAQIQRYD